MKKNTIREGKGGAGGGVKTPDGKRHGKLPFFVCGPFPYQNIIVALNLEKY